MQNILKFSYLTSSKKKPRMCFLNNMSLIGTSKKKIMGEENVR